jgi:hypothetical protein
MSNDLRDLLDRGAARPSSDVDVDALVRTARGRQRRRVGMIVGGIAAVVAVVIGGVAIAQSSSEVSVSARAAASSPAGWTTVTNDDGDVSLAIPPEWTNLEPWSDETITVGTAAFPRAGTILPCSVGHAQVPTIVGTWVTVFEGRDLRPNDEFPMSLVPALRTTDGWVGDRPADLRTAVASTGACGVMRPGVASTEASAENGHYEVLAFRDAGRVLVALLATTNPGNSTLDDAYDVLNTLIVGEGTTSPATGATTPTTRTTTTAAPAPSATAPVGTVDVSADEAAVRDVFLAWINAQPKDALDDIVEDFASIAETHRQGVAQHTDADLALYSGQVDSVAIVSPTRAEVQYTILHDGVPSYSRMSGEAIKIDGKWMVTRQTVCNLLEYGGLTCPPRS